MNKVDFDKDAATTDATGNVTAKNQNGLDSRGRPRKTWRFGDSLAGVQPTKVAGVQPMHVT